ncbi:methyl-accepting chemotaxis protein [Cohnella sp. GCM10027633]|uniref:methyl-accepting chemotaxis protein n=1 Tax=unclassified Cohnella TaxID=2636738 RepID=UPI00364567C1
MSEKLLEMHKKNKLMVWLLVGTLFLGIAISDPIIQKTLAMVGIPFCLLCLALVWRKIAVPYIMYLVSVGLAVIDFLFINKGTTYDSMYLIYFSLAIISIYHDYRPLVLSGVLGIGMSIYFTQTNEIFQTIPATDIVAYQVVTLAALIAQSVIGSKIVKKSEVSAQESVAARDRTENVLSEVKQSVQVLGQSIHRLQQNASQTGEITNQVVSAFTEIAKGIETQSNSVSDISSAIHHVRDNVNTTTDASVTMSEKSKATAEFTSEGKSRMEELSGKMNEIDRLVTGSSAVMNEVSEENVKIESIVSTIRDIAYRTNMLSLNASIEASRAGEHGRGFTVVATEIRKLAQHAQVASTDISDILASIQGKIEHAASLVHQGKTVVETGKQSAGDVERLFGEIQSNADIVLGHADRIRELSDQLNSASGTVSQEIATVAAFSEQSAASVEEVLASSHSQQHHVEDIVKAIAQLDGLMSKLEEIVKR